MTERIPKIPPSILPIVQDMTDRPLWSVMIPTYNCTSYLSKTLDSVLIQDPGEDVMQIEVIDDCSTDDDVVGLIEVIGKGRIKYFRQEQNSGSLRNFETCLNRSKGQLVHLLHGDDIVNPGFYKEIENLFSAYPEAGAAFTNHSTIRRNKVVPDINKGIIQNEPGIIKDFLLKIARYQPLQPPAMVVKRSVYEHLGGFFAVHYGEDWEMWTRIAAHYPVAYSPKCLASYRFMRDGSITHLSHINGQNVIDMLKVMDIIQTYLPPDKRKNLKKESLKLHSVYMAQGAHTIYAGYKEAAFRRVKEAWKIHKNTKTLYYIMKLYLKKLVGFKGSF